MKWFVVSHPEDRYGGEWVSTEWLERDGFSSREASFWEAVEVFTQRKSRRSKDFCGSYNLTRGDAFTILENAMEVQFLDNETKKALDELFDAFPTLFEEWINYLVEVHLDWVVEFWLFTFAHRVSLQDANAPDWRPAEVLPEDYYAF